MEIILGIIALFVVIKLFFSGKIKLYIKEREQNGMDRT